MPQTILIIEDTADIAGAWKTLIEMKGYRALVARDVYVGCRLTKAERPGLILMDLELPGMDGIEAIRGIRSQPSNAETPIVCVSSFASRDVSGALKPGARRL